MNERDTNSPEANQVTAIARMPADMAILKLENDTIQSLAAARPRDMEVIKAEIVAQLKAFPTLAHESIYHKPVGFDQETGGQKIAEGLSVRAAEGLAEVYGYNRIRVDVTSMDENSVKVEATFTDYQRGRIWQDAGVVSKFYRAKGGSTAKHPEDRFYGVVVKAESSRRVREVILRSINPGLKAWYWDQCEKIIGDTMDDKAVAKILASFAGMGVTKDHIERYLGKLISTGLLQEDRVKLVGIWNAIRDKETNTFEAFGITPPAGVKPDGATPASQTGANGAVNADSFTNPKAPDVKPEVKPDAKPAEPVTQQPTAATEPAAVTGETQTPPAGETPPEAKQETPPVAGTVPLSVFQQLVNRLDQCTTIGEVTKLYGEAVKAGFTEDEAYRFEAIAETRKQAIRANKPAKNNSGALVA